MHLRLGTRASALARAQSGRIADALLAVASDRGIDLDVEFVEITTHGDMSRSTLVGLSEAGVFVTALREALLADECDLVVHSMKDMPVAPFPGLTLAATPTRGDARDALCTNGVALADLPQGARIGTGSPRRSAQLLALRPDLDIRPMRGNVDTRLSHIGGDVDGVVLAAAGLERLGRRDDATHVFSVDEMVPAPAQGVLAIEVREDVASHVLDLLATLDDPDARACATAERVALDVLGGGCAAPIAAVATVAGGRIRLHVRVTNEAGSLQLNEMGRGAVAEASAIGRAAGHALLGRGAGRLLGLP